MDRTDTPTLTYFTQNEEELREMKKLAISEFAHKEGEKEKHILLVVCPGHMQDALFETLNANNFENLKGKTIVISPTGHGMGVGKMGECYMEEELRTIKNTTMLIKSYREDFVEIFLEKEKKPYRHFDKHYVPKTQNRKGFTTKGFRTKKK